MSRFVSFLAALVFASPALAVTTATRSLNPTSYTPSQAVTVTITVTPDTNVLSYGVEDTAPVGWTLATTVPNARIFSNVIKFPVYFDSTARTLTYTATPPANDTGTKNFTGSVSTNGVSFSIGGTSSISRADTTGPTVSITSPAGGSTVSGQVTISGTATDTSGVAGVQFRLDGANIGVEDTSAPFTVVWNTLSATNASHSLTAIARDTLGNQTTSAAVSVTVDNASPTISGVSATAITATGATINWTTNENADTQVEYGPTLTYGSQTTLNTTMVLTHAQNLTGLTAGTLYNYRVKSKDVRGNLSISGNFTFTTLPPANLPPTISDITNKSTNEDTALPAVSFTIGDTDTPIANLTLSAASSNTTLVPAANITLGGTGTSRTVAVMPAANQNGTATITISVSDGNTTTTDQFVLTVVSVNDPPDLPFLTNWSINEDGQQVDLLILSDIDTPLANIVMSGTSGNQALIPNANIVFTGSGANRTMTITPLANLSGSSLITFSANDQQGGVTTRTFTLTVNPVNDTPTISNITDQTTLRGVATGAIAFTVGDIETAAGSLTVSGTSGNQTLVPNAGIVFGGSGANRTVTITPAAGQIGTALITVTASDGGQSVNDTFTLTVNAPANTAPTISDILNQGTQEDLPTSAIVFTIGDTETTATSLTVSGTSSNQTLVPNGNIVFGGSGANRTVTISPAGNQNGTTTITITVNDGAGMTASDTFLLTVNAVNDAPTISNVADQTINEDFVLFPLAFTVGDVETSAGSLTVSGTSSNTGLVPNANIVFSGTDANRAAMITPSANQSGQTTITITVNDGVLSVSDTFILTVNPVNDAPTISNLGNTSTLVNTPTGAIGFTVGDIESAAGSLSVSGTSSNQALVPNANIVFGGSGAIRTITLTPASGQTGTSNITVTVSDGGLSATDTFTLTVSATVDSTPPALAIGAPTNGQVFTTANITVSGTASDASGVSVTVNGEAAIGMASWSRAITLVPGLNTITVVARDNSPAQNQTTQSISVTYNPPDTTAPTLSIGSPTNGQVFTTANITVSGTAADAVGVTSVMVNGVTATGTTSWSRAITLVSGSNTINVQARDAAGNTNSQTIQVTYNPPDTTAPALVIGAPADGQVFTTANITVTGTASDASGILSVTVNGTAATGTTSWSRAITLSPGSNTITVVARDNSPAQNQTTRSITVTYNAPANQPPTVDAGPDQTITMPNSATLAGSVTDDGLPNGTRITLWDVVSGPGIVDFVNVNSPTTAVSFSMAGEYVLRLLGSDGVFSRTDDVRISVNPNAPSGEAGQVNEGFALFKNSFKPTEGETITIRYYDNSSSAGTSMKASAEFGEKISSDRTLTIYDRRGGKVVSIEREQLNGSTYEAVWNGRNDKEEFVASGTYLVVLKKGDKVFKRKVVVVK